MTCICLPPDVGEFVSSVEHKPRFLTQTIAVCQSYNGSQSTCSLPKLMRASQGFLTLRLGRDPRSCNWCVSRDGVVVSLQMNEQIDLSIPPSPQLCTVLR